MSRANQSGYFLVELAIIMSVLAFLFISSFAYWLQWLEYQQLRDTGQSLVWYLQQGRSQALRFNRDLLLVQGDRQRRCWLFFYSYSSDGLVTEQANQCWQPPLPSSTQLVILGRPGFYGLQPTAKAGSLELLVGRSRMRILISTRGRIRTSTFE